MKVKIINYKKEYQIINHSEVVLETRKSKWYSSEINFHYNDKHYEIIKSSIWSISRTIFELKQPIGKIFWTMKGGAIRMKNKNGTYNDYTLKKEKIGKWYSSERRYVLNKKDLNPVLTIHYDVKGRLIPTEDISVSFNNVDSTDFVLLVCSLSLIDMITGGDTSVMMG